MAIRNTKLGGVDLTSTTEATYTDLNDTFDAVYEKAGLPPFVQTGLNSIKQMIDRDVPVSAGGIDGFTEAYIDADGRKNSVVTGSTDATFSTDKYTTTSSDTSYILQNITTNILPSTMTSVIGVPFYEDYESGSAVEYRIYNSTTDSGWLNENVLSNVTFTNAPRKLQIKLVPSSTSPSAGYPSINGFYIYGVN